MKALIQTGSSLSACGHAQAGGRVPVPLKSDFLSIQFLGWPGVLSQPIDKEGSARFMRQLVPTPTPCTFKIERAGIRLMGEVALTQYVIHVNCSDTAGVARAQSSRITHTWLKEGPGWKLLGGMSYDQ